MTRHKSFRFSIYFQSTPKQKPEPAVVAQASPSLAARKPQPELKKQSSSPTTKFVTPSNSVPTSPFVARRLKVNQSPVPSANSEVILLMRQINKYFLLLKLIIMKIYFYVVLSIFLSCPRTNRGLSIVRHPQLSQLSRCLQ